MPISLTFNFESEAELAAFMQKVSFTGTSFKAPKAQEKPAKKTTRKVTVKASKSVANKAKPVAKAKPVVKAKPAKAVSSRKTTKPAAASKVAKSATKAKIAGSAKKPVVKKTTTAKGKAQQLSPVIQDAIQRFVKAGKPFKSSDVALEVIKKNPAFKENSVTTATFKALGQTNIKYKLMKEGVGRSYKLYTP